MHVNVSASELSDPDFERTLVQIVEHHGLDPSEFDARDHRERRARCGDARKLTTIGRMRERGFKICIDDFGTGYSSLRYLQQFEVDAIKIDAVVRERLDGRLASEPIVRTLISLAEAYDVRDCRRRCGDRGAVRAVAQCRLPAWARFSFRAGTYAGGDQRTLSRRARAHRALRIGVRGCEPGPLTLQCPGPKRFRGMRERCRRKRQQFPSTGCATDRGAGGGISAFSSVGRAADF